MNTTNLKMNVQHNVLDISGQYHTITVSQGGAAIQTNPLNAYERRCLAQQLIEAGEDLMRGLEGRTEVKARQFRRERG